ncbi:MAG: OmpH family outer membrane protein [Hyphomicrobium sp.]
MHGLIKTLVAACLAAGTCGGPALAASADGGEKQVPLNVAILDVQSVFQNAAAVKSIQVAMRTYIEAYRAGTQREEEEIRAAQQELARKRETLSGEQYEAERRKLEQRLLEAQARVQERKRGLDKTQQQGMNAVQMALNSIVTEIANEQGITLILRKDQTVLNATALEITDEVLNRLNARLPTIDIAGPRNE